MGRYRRPRGAAAALAILAACGGGRAEPPTAPPAPTVIEVNAVVVRVVDGDTIDVTVNGVDERVRLIGIDTPETKRPDTPVECYGPEASARTASLLPAGTPVRLERDAEPRDPYGRLLAYVHRGSDGLFVNVDLVRSGHARPLTIEPNTSHAADLAAAARAAHAAAAGLWSACAG